MAGHTGGVIGLGAGNFCRMTINTDGARLLGDAVRRGRVVRAGSMAIIASAGNACLDSPTHRRIGALMAGIA